MTEESETGSTFFIGYDHAFQNFIVGLELSRDNFGGYIDTGLAELNDMLQAKLRVGYPLDFGLVYGFVGRTEVEDEDEAFDGDGISYGIGFEYSVNDNLFVGIEASKSKTDTVISGKKNSIEELGRKNVALRVGYKF